MAYKPSFDRDPRGVYNYYNNFASIVQGSDAYLLEDTVNEMQWLQVQNKINENSRQFTTGYSSFNSLMATSGGTNLVRLGAFDVMLGGVSIHINPMELSSIPTGAGKVLVYIEAAFKKIMPDVTSIALNGVYRNGTAISSRTIDLVDNRLNLRTAGRVQLVYNIGFIKETTNITNTIYNLTPAFIKTTHYEDILDLDVSADDNIMYGIISEAVSNEYVRYKFNESDDILSVLVPLFEIERDASRTTINITTDIKELLPRMNIKNGDTTVSDAIDSLTNQFADLRNQFNNLSSLILSDQEAYGLSMAVATNTYIGSTNLDGRAVQIKNYSQVNDNIVYQITNLGNNYYGQIGERWTRMDGYNLKVSNTGKNNVMFQVNHFRNDNEEIAYIDINSNSTTGVQLDWANFKQGTVTKNISSWDFSKCIICAIPKYTATQSDTPSIGSWWITKSGSTVKFYNSGAANIPFRIFVLLVTHENLVLKNATLSNSTIVNDAFGRHHEVVATETYDIQYIMLGTPIYTASTVPNDIDIGELYLEKGKESYMISTTSNGINVQIPYLIFKTTYKVPEVNS